MTMKHDRAKVLEERGNASTRPYLLSDQPYDRIVYDNKTVRASSVIKLDNSQLVQ